MSSGLSFNKLPNKSFGGIVISVQTTRISGEFLQFSFVKREIRLFLKSLCRNNQPKYQLMVNFILKSQIINYCKAEYLQVTKFKVEIQKNINSKLGIMYILNCNPVDSNERGTWSADSSKDKGGLWKRPIKNSTDFLELCQDNVFPCGCATKRTTQSIY